MAELFLPTTNYTAHGQSCSFKTAFMKHLLFVAFLAMFTNSYDNITEEIYLNEDGSGKYNVYTNKVPAMKLAIMEKFRQENNYQGEEILLEKMAESKIWEENSDNFSYSTSAKQDASEAVLKDPTKRGLLSSIISFTVGNKLMNSINTGVMCKFKSLEELNQLMQLTRLDPLRDFKSLDLSTQNEGMEILKNKLVFNTNTSSNPTIQVAPNGTFKTVLYLPKKVKKVKSKYLSSKKDQVVTMEYNLADVYSGKVNTGFQIKWKK